MSPDIIVEAAPWPRLLFDMDYQADLAFEIRLHFPIGCRCYIICKSSTRNEVEYYEL